MSDPPRLTSTLGERLKYRLIPGSLYIRYRALKEQREGEPEIGLLPFLIDRARNAIDAGANKGIYTYFIAKLARHVFAFEPNPKMVRILRRNIGRNVTVSALALSDVSGAGVMRIPFGRKGHSNQGGSLSGAKPMHEFTPVAVETRRIDDLDLPAIGFIKIDVEGHEAAVVRGAERTIRRDRPNLLVEIEERHNGRRIEQSLRQFADLDYAGWIMRSGVLAPLSEFDPERHHRSPTSGYVFNFIFTPRERGLALPEMIAGRS